MVDSYGDDGVSSCHRKDVSTGDDLHADGLDLGFDAVDHVETSYGVLVGECILLSREVGRVIQQDRSVATLRVVVIEIISFFAY